MSILERVIAAVIPSPLTEGQVDALDVLKKDHDDVDALLKNMSCSPNGMQTPAKDERYQRKYAVCLPCTR